MSEGIIGRQELDFKDIGSVLFFLWREKLKIILITAAVTSAGITYSIFASPVYYSESIVAAKESGVKSQLPSMLGQLGGLAGISTGVGHGMSLDRLEVIFRSRAIAESVLSQQGILPALYPDSWNPENKTWRDSGQSKPDMRKAVEDLRTKRLQIKVEDKKGFIRVGIFANQPHLSHKIVLAYLSEVSEKIHNTVLSNSENNIQFLNNRLIEAHDPLVKEKIHNLIAAEVEKAMLVSSESIEVLEPPVAPYLRIKPNRKSISAASLVFGLLFSLIVLALEVVFPKVLRSKDS